MSSPEAGGQPYPSPYPSPYPRPWHPAYNRLVNYCAAGPVLDDYGYYQPEPLPVVPDRVLPGPCAAQVCTTFHCVCGLDPDRVRHFAAWVIGLHPATGGPACGCGLPRSTCPHAHAIAELTG